MKITMPDGQIVEIGSKEDIELYQVFVKAQETAKTNGCVIDNPKTARMKRHQYDTFSYLVDNDCEEGVPIDAVARHFGITSDAAGQRLSVMARSNLIRRVTAGRYRAE